MSCRTSLDRFGYLSRRQPLLRYVTTGVESGIRQYERKRDWRKFVTAIRFTQTSRRGSPRDDIVLELEGFLSLFW